jgi:hypothetical protein
MKREVNKEEQEKVQRAAEQSENKVTRAHLDGGHIIMYKNYRIFVKGRGAKRSIHVSYNYGSTWDKPFACSAKSEANVIRKWRKEVRLINRNFVEGQTYKVNETHYFTRFNSVDKVVFYKCLGNNKFANSKGEPVELRDWQLAGLQPVVEGDEEKSYNMHVALPAKHWKSKYKKSWK